eukprot:m51a1_g4639 putative protein disulfide-isomerase (526) ;mRNA; r:338750-341186
MKWQYIALALAALTVAAVAEEPEHKEEAEPAGPSDVVVLTDETHDDAVAKNPVIMVEYYAPWCGHCKALAPEYEKAATALKGKAVIAKVDATTNEKTAQAQGVRGFPTVRLFLNGKPVEFNGPRTAEGIAAFINKAMQPALSVLSTAEQVAEFKKGSTVAVIAYFPGAADPAAVEATAEGPLSLATFKSVAEAGKMTSPVSFAIVTEAALLAADAKADAIALRLFRRADNAEYPYDVTAQDTKGLLQWANLFSLLPLDEIGPSNYQRYMELHMPMFWLCIDPSKDNDAVKETVTTLAKEFAGKMLFIWLDTAKYGGQAKYIGLSGNVVPSASIMSEQGSKFPFDEQKALTLEDLRAHVSDVLAGKATPFIKSAEVPADNEQRDVFEVVGKTFKEVSEDATRDVLIEFYAEYCGHCKALAPIYEQLGKLLKPVSTLRIARVNVPENDVTAQIQGFPTILLFPAGETKTPVEYQGDRTLSSLLNFVKEHAKTPFEFPAEAKAALEAKPEPEHEEEHEEAEEGEKKEL